MTERSDDTIERLVRDALSDALAGLEPDARDAAVRRVTEVVRSRVEDGVQQERRRCLQLCEHRSELWEKTALAKDSAPEHARDEARARRNEAEYIADLITAGADHYGTPDA